MTDDRVRELEARLDALSRRLEVAEEQTEWLEDQLRERDARLEDVEQELDAIKQSTELIEKVDRSAANAPTERAAIIIQTLHNRAANTDGRASADVNDAINILGGGVDRTTMYGTLERAETLVDDADVVEYRKEPRSSSKNTRLVLNLNNGDVPERAAGFKLRSRGD